MALVTFFSDLFHLRQTCDSFTDYAAMRNYHESTATLPHGWYMKTIKRPKVQPRFPRTTYFD